MPGPVGRERERELAATFTQSAASARSALTVSGEPGMGKTTLSRHTAALAAEAGHTVLLCHPSEAESSLSYAGLTDLLASVDDTVIERLPAPQRHALSVATLRVAGGPADLDERAIGTGLAGVLTGVAEGGPVLLVIDDLPWLDQPTLDALAFALRRSDGGRSDAGRADGGPISLLTCRRTDSTRGRELVAALRPDWQQELGLDGLSLSSLFRIIQAELGVSLSRPVMGRITEVSGGNPYVAIELARTLVARGGKTPADLTVPDSLISLHADRLGRLSPAAREALLAIACAPRPTAALLDDLGLTAGADEAEGAGVITRTGERIAFEHPLLASATIELATPPDRRRMHARLHDLATDAEARARHGALARPGADEGVAAALDTAVDSAEARGAPLAAADFARMAVERSVDPDGPAAWRRRVRLAELLHTTGASIEAADVLDRLATHCPPGDVRARGWLVMVEVSYQTSSTARAQECARAALADADDVTIQARALLSLATLDPDGRSGAEHAAEASRRLEAAGSDDTVLLAWAACENVTARFNLGQGLDVEALDRALELERTGRAWRSSDQVAAVRPTLLKFADQYDAALAGLHELRAKAEEEGNDGLLPYVVGHLPLTYLRHGQYDEAVAAAAEHLALAEATGQASQRAQALYNVAVLDVHRGDLAAAEETAHEILRYADEAPDPWMDLCASAVLGLVELSRDNAAQAADRLDRWHWLAAEFSLADPGVSRFYADHIEAHALAGNTGRARELTDELQRLATAASRGSAIALAARCRGLLAAVDGDQDAAMTELAAALRLHDDCPVPFERARTLLLLGTVQRRARRKREAADTLAEAAAEFARLHADGWRARVEAELARVAPRRSQGLELTATEQRVAELAGSGLTNRQVAEQVFISVKTVEANLARVYRKLGISSRAELGARMAHHE